MRVVSWLVRGRALLVVTAVIVAGALTVPPAVAQGGEALVSDDFSDPASGVMPNAVADAEAEYGYLDGEYRLAALAGRPQTDIALPIGQQTYEDSAISIRARLVGDVANRRVFVTCRHSAAGYYIFVVTPDESNFFMLRVLRRANVVSQIDLMATGAVLPSLDPAEYQRLELRCAGSTISAALNGRSVATVVDDTLPAGRHFLGVSSNADELIDVRFADLVISEP